MGAIRRELSGLRRLDWIEQVDEGKPILEVKATEQGLVSGLFITSASIDAKSVSKKKLRESWLERHAK